MFLYAYFNFLYGFNGFKHVFNTYDFFKYLSHSGGSDEGKMAGCTLCKII